MLHEITLSTGRTVVHTREPNGSTLATPTPDNYAFTSKEIAEYQRITAELKLNNTKVPATFCWTE
jgi:hypothetical protein